MKKHGAFIEETKQSFNKAVGELFQTYIKYEIGLKMENLNVAYMRTSMLVARELIEKRALSVERKDFLEVLSSRVWHSKFEICLSLISLQKHAIFASS